MKSDDLRYAELIDVEDGTTQRVEFRELRVGDLFRLFEPDGTAVDDYTVWRALTDGDEGSLMGEPTKLRFMKERP